MKKILLLGLMSCYTISFSQVSIEKNKLLNNGQTYKISQYEKVFSNSEALILMKKSRTNNTIAQIFGFTGGLAIGTGLGIVITGGNSNYTDLAKKDARKKAWTVVGIGAGLVGIGIPFALSSKKNQDKALEIENSNSKAFQSYLKVESNGTGLALRYNF